MFMLFYLFKEFVVMFKNLKSGLSLLALLSTSAFASNQYGPADVLNDESRIIQAPAVISAVAPELNNSEHVTEPVNSDDILILDDVQPVEPWTSFLDGQAYDEKFSCNELLQNSICRRLQGKNLRFGNVIIDESESKNAYERNAITRQKALLAPAVGTTQDLIAAKTFRFDKLLEMLDSAEGQLSNDQILDLARGFRHIKRPRTDYPFKLNVLGDFVCEHLLLNRLQKLQRQDNLVVDKTLCMWYSDALYQLSQVYSHLIEFGDRTTFDERHGRELCIPDAQQGDPKTYLSIYREDLLRAKLHLLQCALKYNSNNVKPLAPLLVFASCDDDDFPKTLLQLRDELLTQFKVPVSALTKQALKKAYFKSLDAVPADFRGKEIMVRNWIDDLEELAPAVKLVAGKKPASGSVAAAPMAPKSMYKGIPK
jgi:hypothetical protein